MHVEGSRRGLFVTLEGPDGSGKSTQAERVAARLRGRGIDCLATREPGGTPLGEAVREILMHADPAPVPTADALLFSAARAQHVVEVIEPALAAGTLVVCDRFADSTLAYQGYGYGQPLEALRRLGEYATGGLRPNLTVLLDLPVEDGLRRKFGTDDLTRFETAEQVDFHTRVREGFLALATADPDRWVVVDARIAPDDLEREIVRAIESRLADSKGIARNRPEIPRETSEPRAPEPRMNR